MKQPQYSPLPIEKQIIVIHAAVKGFCDRMPLDRISQYERAVLSSIDPELLQSIHSCLKFEENLNTWAHHAILAEKEQQAVYASVATVLPASVFIGFKKWSIILYSEPGIVPNPNHGARKRSLAGQGRWLGRRPIVRGIAAMTGMDHLRGGGGRSRYVQEQLLTRHCSATSIQNN